MNTPTNPTKIAWVQQDLKEIMDYFVRGFKLDEGKGKIVHHQWFLDTEKRTVIFKLFVQE